MYNIEDAIHSENELQHNENSFYDIFE